MQWDYTVNSAHVHRNMGTLISGTQEAHVQYTPHFQDFKWGSDGVLQRYVAVSIRYHIIQA